MTPTEDLLIDKAVHGDSESLAALLEKYGPRLRQGLTGQIPRRWRSLVSEDDVMQQTYADAMRYISSFFPRGDGSFARWLATLRNNNLRDALDGLKTNRRGGQARRIEPTPGDQSYVALLETLAVTASTPSRCASREENLVCLRHAIRQLPKTYAHVIQMYDLEGRPVAEVAAALGRSPGAVFMLLARAHARLQETMGSASAYLSTI